MSYSKFGVSYAQSSLMREDSDASGLQPLIESSSEHVSNSMAVEIEQLLKKVRTRSLACVGIPSIATSSRAHHAHTPFHYSSPTLMSASDAPLPLTPPPPPLSNTSPRTIAASCTTLHRTFARRAHLSSRHASTPNYYPPCGGTLSTASSRADLDLSSHFAQLGPEWPHRQPPPRA